MKRENPYKESPDYLTFGEAVDEVGVALSTFRKYAERLGIYGERISRYTYYRREDVETLRSIFSWGAQDLIVRLETMTGKKVYLQ